MENTLDNQLNKLKQIIQKYKNRLTDNSTIYGYYYGKPITDINEYRDICKKDLKFYCEQIGIGYWESIGEQH